MMRITQDGLSNVNFADFNNIIMEVEDQIPVSSHVKAGNEDVEMTDRLEERKMLPFVEKYRPDSLDDIVSHEEIVETSKPANLSRQIC